MIGRPPQTLRQAFLSKIVVQTNECWHFTGGEADEHGYRRFCFRGRRHIFAHRFAYRLFVGSLPKKLCVLHTCDNPQCVNPKHLFLGTNVDNNADKVAKGRHSRGETMGTAKLNEDKVRLIVTLVQVGNTHRSVAKLFGVTRPTVGNIMNNKTWKEVA